MHENGVQNVVLTEDKFDEFIKSHDMAFVDIYMPWYIWCKRLFKTWEKFAEEVRDKKMPVGVGSVNCVEQIAVFRSQRVMDFPTIPWFSNGKDSTPDYKVDHTVLALVSFSKRKLDRNERYKQWENREEKDTDKETRKRDILRSKKAARSNKVRADYLGCQVSG